MGWSLKPSCQESLSGDVKGKVWFISTWLFPHSRSYCWVTWPCCLCCQTSSASGLKSTGDVMVTSSEADAWGRCVCMETCLTSCHQASCVGDTLGWDSIATLLLNQLLLWSQYQLQQAEADFFFFCHKDKYLEWIWKGIRKASSKKPWVAFIQWPSVPDTSRRVALELSYLIISDTGCYKSKSIPSLCMQQILVRSAESTCSGKQAVINFSILKSYQLLQILFFFGYLPTLKCCKPG